MRRGFPAFPRLQRLQILDQILLLAVPQAEAEVLVVVVDHVPQRPETPVVIEAAFLVRP